MCFKTIGDKLGAGVAALLPILVTDKLTTPCRDEFATLSSTLGSSVTYRLSTENDE